MLALLECVKTFALAEPAVERISAALAKSPPDWKVAT
jgi:hypothetical protein